MSNLVTALPYRFYLVAFNTNGAGLASNIATYPPCNTPSGFARPSRVSSSLTSITISWQEPLNNGGCSITGYAVFVDNGANGPFVEANVNYDISVRNIPTLTQL